MVVFLFGCLASLAGRDAMGDEIRVAVAANFAGPMKAIVRAFEARTGHRVVVSVGSTGKHYAQIRGGAPFAVFFAADAERPRLLEEEGLSVAGTRFTYAMGRLVLWSPNPGLVDPAGRVLSAGTFSHLALANPRLAPYGAAAQQVLESRGLWTALEKKLVRGQSVGQVYQFIETGNAELGFVAMSQVGGPDRPLVGSWWVVPDSLYAPIEQQAVILEASEAARALVAFVRGAEGRRIISKYGYRLPR